MTSSLAPDRGAAPARRAALRRRAGPARRRRRPPTPAGLAAVAAGGGDLPPRRRDIDHPQVHRPAAPDGGGRGDPRHRPRAAAARRARHREDLGLGAPRRGDQRRLHPAGAGHGRHRRGGDPLRLELRPAAGRGAVARRARAEPGDARHGRGAHRPGGGADPHALRRPGRADHHPVGEDAAHPRAQRRGAGRKGFNIIATANDRDRGVNELSSALRRRFNTVVLPVPATAEEEVDIVSRRVDAARPLAGAARGARRGWRRSAEWSRSSASCATGITEDGRTKLKSPAARSPPPRPSPW